MPIKLSEIKDCLIDRNKCQLCGGNLILHKSTFEQYQPSIYQCDKCKNELSIPQMHKAEAILHEQGQVELDFDLEKLAKSIHEYWRNKCLETGTIKCRWEELHDAGREGYLEEASHFRSSIKEILVVVK